MSRDPNFHVQSFLVCGQTMLEQGGAKYCDLTAPSILLNINRWDVVLVKLWSANGKFRHNQMPPRA